MSQKAEYFSFISISFEENQQFWKSLTFQIVAKRWMSFKKNQILFWWKNLLWIEVSWWIWNSNTNILTTIIVLIKEINNWKGFRNMENFVDLVQNHNHYIEDLLHAWNFFFQKFYQHRLVLYVYDDDAEASDWIKTNMSSLMRKRLFWFYECECN